jgi:hypothetical protein
MLRIQSHGTKAVLTQIRNVWRLLGLERGYCLSTAAPHRHEEHKDYLGLREVPKQLSLLELKLQAQKFRIRVTMKTNRQRKPTVSMLQKWQP